MLLSFIFLVSGGCVAHTQGLVRLDEGAALLLEPQGKLTRLRLGQDSAPLQHLEGHLADVDGVRSPLGLWVVDWKVPQGLHGMEVWVGPLGELGVQVGVQDRNSGAWYELLPDSASLLRPYVGEVVLVEGYVEGPHQIRVLSYRVLAP